MIISLPALLADANQSDEAKIMKIERDLISNDTFLILEWLFSSEDNNRIILLNLGCKQ